MINRKRNFFVIILILVIGLISLFFWQFSGAIKERFFEDKTYLTPIPQSTLSAYRYDLPITNKVEIVIAARIFLGTTHLEYEEVPTVISVEETTLVKANRKMHDPQSGDYYYEDKPGNTKVWIVIFEGYFRIIAPIPQNPPEPLAHRCAFVIIDQNKSGEVGTMACPE